MLDKHKINYTKAVMYRTVSNDFAPDEPFDYDMLIFFSPAGIQSLLEKFPRFRTRRYKDRYFRPDNRQSRSRCRSAPRLRSSASRSPVDDGSIGIIPQRTKQSGQEITVFNPSDFYTLLYVLFRNDIARCTFFHKEIISRYIPIKLEISVCSCYRVFFYFCNRREKLSLRHIGILRSVMLIL